MVAITLLVATVIGWLQLRDRAADQVGAAAAECVAGVSTLHVTADPGIAAPVQAVAERYNATRPQVRDHCARVVVTAQPSAAIVSAFGSGDPWDDALGPQPALWIADSTRSIESMRVPGLIEGTPVSVAASPIVLAVPAELGRAMEQAETSWADLPRLQNDGLAELGLSGWGGLRLALPDGDSTLAVAAAVGGVVSGVDPISVQAAQSGQVVSAISTLAAHAPEASDTAATLSSVAPREASVHAVATSEQQLADHSGLVGYRPPGSSPIADHPAAVMSGTWVDDTQNLLAGLFTDYLRQPQWVQTFREAGFSDSPQAEVAVPSRAALDALRATMANPVLGLRSTVLVDASASMRTAEGATTRLSNVLTALTSTMTVMPPEFGLGVWTFGENLDSAAPFRMAAPTALLTADQRTTLGSELGAIRPGTNHVDQAYLSLIAAYDTAVADYAPGRTNSILVITDGPDDGSAVTDDQLVARIAAATDESRPVRIDVIVVGGTGSQTLQTLTEQTGGSYDHLATSDDIDFGSAVVRALTTP